MNPKKRTLVTGAGGFIGSHLVESLLANGHEVICLLRRGENPRWIGEMGASLVYGDITEKESLLPLLQDVSSVYHLAGRMGGWDKPSYVYAVNYEGTRNLVDACIESGIKLDRFLFVSSVAAMGPSNGAQVFDEESTPIPQSHYGKSKLMAEEYLRNRGDGFPFSIVRLPLVYGPRSLRGLYMIFKIVNAGFQLRVGESCTNLGFIKDIIRGMILAAESAVSLGQTYFLGEDRIYNVSEIYKLISFALGKKTLKVRIPYPLVYSLTYVIEKVSDITKTYPPIRRDSLSAYIKSNWRITVKKAEKQLNYKTEYPLERGLKATAGWYKEKGLLK
jgi:nucleoside-diphosphate-sugar epimerase